MTKVRFKYTKNHTYKCTRCNMEYDEMPLVCSKCARELGVPDNKGNLPPEYYNLFSPSDRGY